MANKKENPQVKSQTAANNKAEKPKTFGRLIKMVFADYPVLLPFTLFCVLVSAFVSSIPAIFQEKVLTVITKYLDSGNRDWLAAKTEIIPLITVLIILYVISTLLMTFQTQSMAVITQGFLDKTRKRVFNGMQNLPIGFFDTHKHGDIMSHYTNDIDTIRQLISISFPNLLRSAVVVITVLAIMLWYSVLMTLVVTVGIIAMILVAKKIGGGSAKYFVHQQKQVGEAEGYIQEIMNGQKVVKVFNHEGQATKEFDQINEELYQVSYRANGYANALGPIIMNIGNVLYVLTAITSGFFLLLNIRNFSISGMAFSIAVLVPFLNMTKQFTGNLNQLSQQINHVVMAIAGAKRVFDLMDQEAEIDQGKITLTYASIDPSGKVKEATNRTGRWAWKLQRPGQEAEYRLLEGDMRLIDVDFAYEEGKTVLQDISLYAEPGQKVAFVGATGAGKTTITNLLNRFYDIEKGEILYDGINVKEIHKSDLRRSLGIVLQDTNLFSGSVLENIRYGNMDATDEECIAAAHLAGAHDFITRLPEGYQSDLSNNGSNLSQGQRQLIAIARAAVADPPVLILDEATSSIDTRTESIVQKGMDQLMKGRTVFVIAHRLSTIKNSDVIMVMEHGKIIERGTHESLLEEKGNYYQLYTGAFELE